MPLHHFTGATEEHVLAALSQIEGLSLEEIRQAIVHEWQGLQRVPSYAERQHTTNRDLIEGISHVERFLLE